MERVLNANLPVSSLCRVRVHHLPVLSVYDTKKSAANWWEHSSLMSRASSRPRYLGMINQNGVHMLDKIFPFPLWRSSWHHWIQSSSIPLITWSVFLWCLLPTQNHLLEVHYESPHQQKLPVTTMSNKDIPVTHEIPRIRPYFPGTAVLLNSRIYTLGLEAYIGRYPLTEWTSLPMPPSITWIILLLFQYVFPIHLELAVI